MGGVAGGTAPRRGGSGIKMLPSATFLWSEGETSPLKICFEFDFYFDFKGFKDFKDFDFYEKNNDCHERRHRFVYGGRAVD
jgi:hypothetical protein